MRQHADQPFDLARGPLIRARLLIDEHRTQLLVTLHHIVADGWSLEILHNEIGTLYRAFARGEPSPLPPLPLQYADVAEWQHTQMQGERLAAHLAYWREQLAGAPLTLDMPADRRRPVAPDYRGAALNRRVPASVAEGLQALAQREGATLFMVLLAAFAVVLSRQSGQHDLVIGAPVAGRTRVELEPLIGCFLNHLPLRIDLGGAPTFSELLARVRDVTLGAYAHQELPFEILLENLRPERHASHTPVFQVFLNLLNFGALEHPVTVRPPVEIVSDDDAAPVATWSPFDFTLYATERAAGLELQIVYRTDLFDAGRMRELRELLALILAQVTERPATTVSDLTLVTPRARRLLPDPTTPLGAEWYGAVHMLFAKHASIAPGRLAVADPDEAWSYGELDARSTALAAHLRASGIGRDDVVAVYAHRSASLVWAVLGTLKAGATYTILDPTYPVARLIEYLELARPVALLGLQAAGPVPAEIVLCAERLGCRYRLDLPARCEAWALPLARPDAPIESVDPVDPDTIACISFTSGSSGQPKGVMQRHGPLTHFVPWLTKTFGLTANDQFTMLSGLSHDPLQRDVFTPLCIGASVHIPAADEIGTPGQLAAWVRRCQITIAHLTPAMAQVLTQHLDTTSDDPMDSLRLIFFVGDKVTRADVARARRLAPEVTCVNFYGATETQRAVGCYIDRPAPGEAAASSPEHEVLPAAKGAGDVQLLVLTSAGALAGVGELGEIHVRSPHLARGYLGDEALTRARFLVNPFTGITGDRMYRTGDLGRYRPDGLLEFVGRADQQVKVRGFRVEPGEVESVLRRDSRVRGVAVVLREAPAGDARLVAYVVATEGETVEAGELRHVVAKQIPDYMIPSVFVPLGKLPLTPNGKLDRAALPDPFSTVGAERPHRPPRDELEQFITALWTRLLGASFVGVDDNFFELGGHSLLAMQVLSRIRDAFRVEIGLRRFFERPTIVALAEEVAEARARGSMTVRPPLVPLPRDPHRAQRSVQGVIAISDGLKIMLRDLMGVATILDVSL
jgi:amino acid adenylation domain-containing protein